MFMNDYSHKGGIRINALNYLSNLGLPCENINNHATFLKLNSNHWNTAKIKFMVESDRLPVKIFRTRIFNVPLKRLHKSQVQLQTGQKLPIPHIIKELCEFILRKAESEEIFRTPGSRTKQDKIKSKIEERGHLNGKNCNVVDVAAILRYFLRTLPEPLIPYSYHDLFLACCDLKSKKKVLLIATLLLPIEHLNLLTYLVHFFNEFITTCSHFNKISSYNLAVCIAGDVIPVNKFSHGIFDRTAEVMRLLITEAYNVGVLTADIRKVLQIDGNFELKANTLDSLLYNFKRFLCYVA